MLGPSKAPPKKPPQSTMADVLPGNPPAAKVIGALKSAGGIFASPITAIEEEV